MGTNLQETVPIVSSFDLRLKVQDRISGIAERKGTETPRRPRQRAGVDDPTQPGEEVETEQHLDPEVLLRELKKAIRHGCRAARLVRCSADFVDQVVSDPALSTIERAMIFESQLRQACDSYEGDWGDAMSTLLGLAPGTHGALLKVRRRQAAYLLGAADSTFRRHTEADLLWDLAVAVALLGNRLS